MVKTTDYVNSKLKHIKKVLGMNGDINPATGAARPEWAKGENEEREKRYTALVKARLRKEENKNKVEVYD